jgi:hypothetical protein
MQTDNVGAEEIKQFVKVHTTASDSAVSAWTFWITQLAWSTQKMKPLQSTEMSSTIYPTAQYKYLRWLTYSMLWEPQTSDYTRV